jgi:hypothetical protein
MRIMSSEEQEDKQWLVVTTTTTMASKLWLNVVLCVWDEGIEVKSNAANGQGVARRCQALQEFRSNSKANTNSSLEHT